MPAGRFFRTGIHKGKCRMSEGVCLARKAGNRRNPGWISRFPNEAGRQNSRLEPVSYLQVCRMSVDFFAGQGKFSQAGCRPARKFNAERRKKTRSDGVPEDFKQALKRSFELVNTGSYMEASSCQRYIGAISRRYTRRRNRALRVRENSSAMGKAHHTASSLPRRASR